MIKEERAFFGVCREFREFIAKGSAIDLAVGIIIGAAFRSIVTSFVTDIIDPIIGLPGKANFDNLFVVLKSGPLTQQALASGTNATAAELEKTGAVVLKYGSFLTNILNFLIVAFAVFLMVKAINKMRREPAPEDAPSPEVALLTEIRDLLKSKF